jgi:hypothetical protein
MRSGTFLLNPASIALSRRVATDVEGEPTYSPYRRREDCTVVNGDKGTLWRYHRSGVIWTSWGEGMLYR